MAMAGLVMPRLPDQQQAWFHHPHHHQPTGHQRSYSYHMPQPQQQFPPQLQPQPQPQSQTQPVAQHINHQAQPQRPSPPGFNNSTDISPLSTSNSTSPVSPKNYHGRQVRPLYMPAVLRPTEYPSSPALPKASPGAEEHDDDERVVRSSGSFTSLSGILSLSRLSRRSTGDSGKVVDWDWDMSNYPKVDGQPTRRHWKPDVESEVCDDPTCKKYFNYFVRRHHCRRCGNIFCDPHSSHEVPLDESANYNPRGQPSRACAHCYGDYKMWRGRNSSHSQTSSVSGRGGDRTPQQHHGSRTVPASPISASPISGASPTTPGKSQPEVALSVPSDWNWSTF